ncbi:extracellular solute-binding protein [Psychrobacillus soli]|uniref:Extracellular solute-binding protein n=1 Tax=Psychrobacillus soli TaxID=1543965 RepID=A0A544SK06_9BACI|nr:extracellular solute-binding protein [Psychrobacillus soli]TQR05519.1 extracellular solute-binding protein [Psychrobacillus soli]
MKKLTYKLLSVLLVSILLLTACTNDKEAISHEKPEGAPDTWIADRTVKGLVFMSDGDVSAEMNPEIAAELKEKTGITLELQGITVESSTEALTSGLASGDLPDFIAYYLDHSGRPEMQILLKGAREGMFHDLTPMLKETNIYSKYFEEGYLPKDTKDNVMFRDEFNDSSYFVHMSIPREAGTVTRKYVGGPYILKDIVDQLGINPAEIDTTEELREVAEQIKAANLKDVNGKPMTPIGPTAWGGADRDAIFNDLVWSGATGEKFLKDTDGTIKHESQTEYGLQRVNFIRGLLEDGLLHPEFFTMEENRAKEGIVNKSFGIVSDMHNYVVQNNDMKYIPLGPIDTVEGDYQMQLNYKSGYAGWSIPKTTEHPEDIVKLADFLASREGKLLSHYGIEGRDYTLDEQGNPLVKKEVLELKENDPEAAAKLGFRGVRSYWAEHLGYTDMDNLADFGEFEYGARVAGEDIQAAEKILQMWNYDEKFQNAKVIDGSTPKSFIFEFQNGDNLNIALDTYNENLLRAYYSKSSEEAKKILNDSKIQLEKAGLNDYINLIQEKESEGTTIKF